MKKKLIILTFTALMAMTMAACGTEPAESARNSVTESATESTQEVSTDIEDGTEETSEGESNAENSSVSESESEESETSVATESKTVEIDWDKETKTVQAKDETESKQESAEQLEKSAPAETESKNEPVETQPSESVPDTKPEQAETTHVHSYDGGTVTTAATCSTDGVMTYACSCGDTKTEAIPATGQHDPIDVWATTDRHADCITPEHHHIECSVCRAYLGSVQGPAWGHTIEYREREIIMDTPCQGVRILEPYCTTCGTTIGLGACHDEPVTLEHDWHEVQESMPYDVDPETGEWLYRTVLQCSKCGECQ